MLDRTKIERAVSLQEKSYQLLLWMGDAVEKGFIEFGTAHTYSTLPEATKGWILGHYENIPERARVERDCLHEFSNFFATYLDNSFDLVENPRERLYSEGAHCFCPICSWLANAPHLQTKKTAAADKKRAESIRRSAIEQIAQDIGVTLTGDLLSSLVKNPQLREMTSLAAYARDLLKRVNGIASGPAVLILWRGFAWNQEGSPKRNFKLTADLIFENERELAARIRGYGNTPD